MTVFSPEVSMMKRKQTSAKDWNTRDAAVSEQQSAELEETLRPQRSVGFVLISTIFVQVDARPAHWVAVGKKLDKTIKKKPASPHTHTMADS